MYFIFCCCSWIDSAVVAGVSPCTLFACLVAVCRHCRPWGVLGMAAALTGSWGTPWQPGHVPPPHFWAGQLGGTRAAPALGTSWGAGPGWDMGLLVGLPQQGPLLGRWAGPSSEELKTGPSAAILGQQLVALRPGMCSCAVGRDTGLQACRTIMAYWCPPVPGSVHHFFLHSTDPTGRWCFFTCCWLKGHPTFLVARLWFSSESPEIGCV